MNKKLVLNPNNGHARTSHVNLYFVKSTSKNVMILRWILLKVELKVRKSEVPLMRQQTPMDDISVTL